MEKQYTLSRNSWHAKMVNFVFGFNHTDFSYLCPYFWLCVLGIVGFIPVVIVRILLIPFKALIVVLNNIKFEYSANQLRKLKRKNFEKWENMYYMMSIKPNWTAIIINSPWKYRGFVFEYLIDKDYLAYKEITDVVSFDAFLRKPKKPMTNRVWIGITALWTKRIATILFLLGVVALLSISVYMIWTRSTVKDWILVGIVISAGFAITAVIFGLVHFFKLKKVQKIIAYPFIQIGRGIVFIYEMFADMCPPINWK